MLVFSFGQAVALMYVMVTTAAGVLTEDVVMSEDDILHMAWVNGPTYSAKLSGGAQWPSFGEQG